MMKNHMNGSKRKKNKMGESVEEHAGAGEAEEKWKEEVEARVKVIELESQKTSEFIQKGIEMCKNQEESHRESEEGFEQVEKGRIGGRGRPRGKKIVWGTGPPLIPRSRCGVKSGDRQ